MRACDPVVKAWEARIIGSALNTRRRNSGGEFFAVGQHVRYVWRRGEARKPIIEYGLTTARSSPG